jgi:phospholipid/cholesterol/gamma-HCH transport system substrate-binding protein
MGKRPRPALLGAFVIGAIVIVAAAIVTVGSGRFFRNTRTFVIFFQGSVNGLAKGAPVKFRGVPIGTVTDIRLAISTKVDVNRIPVLIEIDRDRLEEFGARADVVVGKRLQDLIYKRGLRAQLQQQSFITGLLYVGLDYFPDSKFDLVLPPGDEPYPEIPSRPTTLEEARAKIEELFDRVSRIDFDALGRSVSGALDGVDRLVNSPEVYTNLKALHETLVEIHGTTADLRARVPQVSGDVSATTKDLRRAIERVRASLDRVDSLVDPNAPLLGSLATTLKEVGEAARAIRHLAEELERNPSVLLTGKKEP